MPTGIYKRKPLTEEHKRKISIANRGKSNGGSFAKGSIPWNKGLKGIHLSPKTEFKKGVALRLGIKHTQESKDKMSAARKGLFTEAQRKQISERMKGNKNLLGHKKSKETIAKFKATHAKNGNLRESNSPGWKGDNVKYSALHEWVKRYKGTPKECTQCGLDDPNKTYHWANISHEYSRDLDDFIRMCASCHKYYDNLHRKGTG